MNEEAVHAGELVLLFGNHLNGEFDIGEVGTGQFETLGSLSFVDLDGMRLGVVAGAGLKLLKRPGLLLCYVGTGSSASVAMGGA